MILQFFLIMLIIFLLISIVSGIISLIFLILILWMNIMFIFLSSRRLHDMNISSKYYLCYLIISFLGAFLGGKSTTVQITMFLIGFGLTILLLTNKGTNGHNNYGEEFERFDPDFIPENSINTKPI